MSEMTHRQRVMAAINHTEPDRVPLDLGSTSCSSIHRVAYRNLVNYLNMKPGDEVIWDKMQQIVLPDEQLLEYLDVDTRPLYPGAPDNFKPKDLGERFYADEWGVIRTMPQGSYYYDLHESPLPGEPTIDDLEKFNWPDPDDPGRVRGLKERAEYLHKKTDYAVVLNLRPSLAHTSQYMRGFEGWFMDIALRPEFMNALLDRILDVHIRTIRNIFREIDSDTVDINFIGDDIAVDVGLMISPEAYRTLFKPRHKKIIDCIKEYSDAKIMYHSCGAVQHALDDLIEIGVDIINPVQVSAKGMDTKWLKEEFGSRIVFWGGIDTREILPHGTVDQVKKEVGRVIKDLAPGGGYVLNSVHNIQADVKPENICAMVEAGREYGRYPLG